MQLEKNIVLIIDPFATGALYAPLFQARGFVCYAILSSDTVPQRFTSTFTGAGFEFDQLFNVADALEYFRPEQIAAVVAGSELGVEAADRIAEFFNVMGNDPLTSALRRDKYAMQRALANKGLAHIPSVLIQNQAAIEPCLANFAPQSGYVVKPVNSFMTDGVAFARDHSELRQCLAAAQWGRPNSMGEMNKGFVVQRFIAGPEYVVDLVVQGDNIAVAGLCRYRKGEHHGSRFVYEGLEVLDPNAPSWATLLTYAKSCSKALDIQFGPVHMELIVGDDGPVMIEAGARLHGGVAPSLFAACYAPDLLTLAVDAYSGGTVPKRASEKISDGRIVFLINRVAQGCLSVDAEKLRRLQTLSSYRGIKLFVAADEPLPLTVDLATCPGIVWLAHEHVTQLNADEAAARAIIENA